MLEVKPKNPKTQWVAINVDDHILAEAATLSELTQQVKWLTNESVTLVWIPSPKTDYIFLDGKYNLHN